MSLWYKPIEQIDVADVEAFLGLKHKEGTRLDYKSAFPSDLAKLIAAFANTLGGLIILGVDADKKTNEPVWPPIRGMPDAKGIEERIIQITRDGIYPPVRPEVSRIFPNPHLAGHVIAVVRVFESREAPHAINNGREIYERTGSVTDPIDLANIDRIKHLLERRASIEGEREKQLKHAIERGQRQFGGRVGALRWASVSPLYPWRELCSPLKCFNNHNSWKHIHRGLRIPVLQRVPMGSFCTAFGKRQESNNACVSCSSVSCNGQIFALEYTEEVDPTYRFVIPFDHTCLFARRVFEVSSSFYQDKGIERPGFLLLSIGMLSVLGHRMEDRRGNLGAHYPDNEFRADHIVTDAELLSNQDEATKPLFEKLAYGFDIDSPFQTNAR